MSQMQSLAGIPGTVSADVRRLNWCRHSDDPRTGSRSYSADTATGRLWALVSQDAAGKGGRPLWHVSVSHRDRAGKPDRVPTWDELKHAAYRLVPADVCMVLIFPRRSTPPEKYVNTYETCLHLWESEEDLDR